MPGPRRTDFKKPKNAKKTFGRILQYAGKSKFMLLAVFVMLIASTVCSVGASYWLKPILNDIDASIRAGNFATVGVQSLMRNLAIVSALYIGASLCTYIQSKVMVKIAYKTTNLIRKELFDHMQTLPLRFFPSYALFLLVPPDFAVLDADLSALRAVQHPLRVRTGENGLYGSDAL